MKKILSIFLAVLLVFSAFSLSAAAYTVNTDDGHIGAGDLFGTGAVYFEDATVALGSSTLVPLMIRDNPGVTRLEITVEAAEGVALTEVLNGVRGTAVLNGNTVTVNYNTNADTDDCVAYLNFEGKIIGNAQVVLKVKAYTGADEVALLGSTCLITVASFKRGDIDNDGKVDVLDLILLKHHIVSSEQYPAYGPDLDSNGHVDVADVAILRKLLATIH